MTESRFTHEHLLELRAIAAGGGAEPVGPKQVTAPTTADLAAWGLVHWDAGARTEVKRTLAEHASRVRMHEPSWKLTDAGSIVLELARRLEDSSRRRAAN